MYHLSEVIKSIEADMNRPVMAVYLRGSRMRGNHFDNSDYDITAIVDPTKHELLTGVNYGFRINKPQFNVEGNVCTISHVYKLMSKGSPNTVEMIHSYPKFVDVSFKPIADYLYNKRSEILDSTKTMYMKSHLGMANTYIKRMEIDFARRSNYAFYTKLALKQCEEVLKGKNLDFGVPLSDNLLPYFYKYQYEPVFEMVQELVEEAKSIEKRLPVVAPGNSHVLDDLTDMIFSVITTKE